MCHNKVNKSGYLLPIFIKARACSLSSLCEKPLVIERRKRNCHTHNQRYGESKFALHENPLVFFDKGRKFHTHIELRWEQVLVETSSTRVQRPSDTECRIAGKPHSIRSPKLPLQLHSSLPKLPALKFCVVTSGVHWTEWNVLNFTLIRIQNVFPVESPLKLTCISCSIRFYIVFQGVVLSAVVVLDILSRRNSWVPSLLSLEASVVTLVSLHIKLQGYWAYWRQLKLWNSVHRSIWLERVAFVFVGLFPCVCLSFVFCYVRLMPWVRQNRGASQNCSYC